MVKLSICVDKPVSHRRPPHLPSCVYFGPRIEATSSTRFFFGDSRVKPTRGQISRAGIAMSPRWAGDVTTVPGSVGSTASGTSKRGRVLGASTSATWGDVSASVARLGQISRPNLQHAAARVARLDGGNLAQSGNAGHCQWGETCRRRPKQRQR